MYPTRNYFVQFIYDEDADVKKTFAIKAQGGVDAVNKVEKYCDANPHILPGGKENYTSRVRLLRQRDKADHIISLYF